MRALLLRSAVAVVLTCAAGVSAVSALGSGSDLGVAYQIDVAHTGVQNDANLTPPLVRRWQVNDLSHPSYPLIAGGDVYVTVADDSTSIRTLLAFDQANGQLVWSQPLGVGFVSPWSDAAYDAGRVFVAENDSACCDDGLLRAFDAATGTPLWTARLPGQYFFNSPPTAANGFVYTAGAGSGGTLYAVDEVTGAVVATQPVENGDTSSPALSNGGVFVSYACNQVYGFAQSTLAPLWRYQTGCEGGGGATPVYSAGQVFVRDFVESNLVLDAATGSPIRSFAPTTSPLPPAPAVDASTIFMLVGGRLTAQDRTSGTTEWTFAGDGQLSTAPIVIANGGGEWVIEGSAAGRLYALDALKGTPVWSTQLPAGIPSVDESLNFSLPLTGLSAGQGLLVVPAGNTLTAFGAACRNVATRWHYSADGSAGKWSTTKSVDCSTGNVTNGPQAMEGDLKVDPGTAIRTGYDLQLPGNKLPRTAVVTNAKVVFQLRCVSGAPASPSTLTVSMGQASYAVSGSEWEPTGDQRSSLGYQGSGTVPDACNGSRVRLDKGGTFSANVTIF